jgi:hypothetical protein
MMSSLAPTELPRPLAYHLDLSAFLAEHEDGLWKWFASDKMTDKAYDEARLYLLKNAVRLDRDTHGGIYDAADAVARALSITAPVIVYQMSGGGQRNASLVPMRNEVAILLQGDVQSFLTAAELVALLAHEMAHFQHHHAEEGRLLLADRLLDWICGEPASHKAHARSLWLSRLYQEIYADRIALHVCGDLDTTISMLIKMTSGLDRLSAKAYLEQAREALDMVMGGGTQGLSHPESYIRAIAMADWAADPAEADRRLGRLVEGKLKVEQLDLLSQREVTAHTRAIITSLLARQWPSADALESHARAYFPDFDSATAKAAELPDFSDASDSMKAYVGYVLADFASIDPELDDLPLMAAFDLSAKLGIAEAFDAIAAKDLDIKPDRVAAIRASRQDAAQDTAKGASRE